MADALLVTPIPGLGISLLVVAVSAGLRVLAGRLDRLSGEIGAAVAFPLLAGWLLDLAPAIAAVGLVLGVAFRAVSAAARPSTPDQGAVSASVAADALTLVLALPWAVVVSGRWDGVLSGRWDGTWIAVAMTFVGAAAVVAGAVPRGRSPLPWMPAVRREAGRRLAIALAAARAVPRENGAAASFACGPRFRAATANVTERTAQVVSWRPWLRGKVLLSSVRGGMVMSVDVITPPRITVDGVRDVLSLAVWRGLGWTWTKRELLAGAWVAANFDVGRVAEHVLVARVHRSERVVTTTLRRGDLFVHVKYVEYNRAIWLLGVTIA